MRTYKVKFIFFKLYKSIELSAHNVSDAEKEVCEKYGISQQMKQKCGFKTTLVK
jgi:hypothetical protein